MMSDPRSRASSLVLASRLPSSDLLIPVGSAHDSTLSEKGQYSPIPNLRCHARAERRVVTFPSILNTGTRTGFSGSVDVPRQTFE
jgi:hypothetical protein